MSISFANHHVSVVFSSPVWDWDTGRLFSNVARVIQRAVRRLISRHRKLAIMMAFHKRLGNKSLIGKMIPADLFATLVH